MPSLTRVSLWCAVVVGGLVLVAAAVVVFRRADSLVWIPPALATGAGLLGTGWAVAALVKGETRRDAAGALALNWGLMGMGWLVPAVLMATGLHFGTA